MNFNEFGQNKEKRNKIIRDNYQMSTKWLGTDGGGENTYIVVGCFVDVFGQKTGSLGGLDNFDFGGHADRDPHRLQASQVGHESREGSVRWRRSTSINQPEH